MESICLSELTHTTDAAVTEMTICDLLSEKVVLFVRSVARSVVRSVVQSSVCSVGRSVRGSSGRSFVRK